MSTQREILFPGAVLRGILLRVVVLREILTPKVLLPVVWLVAGLLLAPADASGQETIYQASELTEQPRIANAKQARTAIMRSYTANLQSAGLQGRVEVAFVVNADGSVDSESVEVIRSPEEALSAAAKVAVARIRFQPGKKDGTPVRCRVAMPISYGQAG